MATQTYNSDVRAHLLNRLAAILSFIGVFIAGSLTVQHAMHVDLPCGLNKGCEQVADSPYAFLFGIPVAYIGLGSYLALAAIASFRLMAGLSGTKHLGFFALFISGVGAVFSLYLQYQSFFAIKAECPWCIASAVTMSLLFVINGALYSANDSEAAKNPVDLALIPALSLAAAMGIAFFAFFQTRPELPGIVIPPSPPIPKGALTLGPDNAPIKLVEFTDLLCPSCRRSHPEVKKFIADHPGRVQLIVRHFPLYTAVGHEFSMTAAFYAEYATEKGKGWEYIDAVMDIPAKEITSQDPLLRALKIAGLDADDAAKRLEKVDPSGKGTDRAFARVYEDLQFVDALGINQTPSFVVLAEGQPARLTKRPGLFKLLETPTYKRILDGK
jgi:uncharacterized membrane protein/predicted DsbA family dithiol-disulfide isomerase